MPDQINPIIRLNGVSRYFGATRAVDNVSLDVMRGEFFALIGPSGCGKTTLLRILGGFETPDTGDIFIDGRDVKGVPANKRPVNLVFQSYAIFPHMNVAENVGYGLRIAGLGRDEIRDRIQQVLTLVKLPGQENKRPDQLSGGQRQRVALARALIMRPAVLLLDEPMSALDAKLREAMRLELVHLQKNVGITFVLVTHDQSEALSMAGRIAVMHEGAVRQVASPKQLYDAPNCRFVADFIGKINFFEATASAAPNKNRVRINAAHLGEMELDGNARGAVTLGVRPEKIQISREPITQNGAITLHGKVADIAYFGGSSSISIDIGAPYPLMAQIPNFSSDDATAISPGDVVWCSWRSADTLLLMD